MSMCVFKRATILGLILAASLASGTRADAFSGYYKILARHSGKAVVVQSASTADGAALIQYTYGGSATNDEWQLVDLGTGYYKILNHNSGKAMVVQSASTADGAKVVQWTYNDN